MTVLRAEDCRVFSGPLQIGTDWPGLFVRADECIQYMEGLEIALSALGVQAKVAEDSRYASAAIQVAYLQRILEAPLLSPLEAQAFIQWQVRVRSGDFRLARKLEQLWFGNRVRVNA